MNEQERAFFAGGKRMSMDEIKASLTKGVKDKKGSFNETERLKKEISDFTVQWFKRAIGGFVDSKAGEKFIEEHEGQSPDDVVSDLINNSNLSNLYNAALRRKIAKLRGKIV